jgi:hypothetical protein
MIEADFNPKQKVSSFIAFTFIILLGVLLGWYAIKIGEEIEVNLPNSEAFNIEKRTQSEELQENPVPKNMTKKSGLN